jgi:hypothetical protein
MSNPEGYDKPVGPAEAELEKAIAALPLARAKRAITECTDAMFGAWKAIERLTESKRHLKDRRCYIRVATEGKGSAASIPSIGARRLQYSPSPHA